MTTSLVDLERKHHWTWMIGSLGLVWALWLVPFFWYRNYVENQLATTALLGITAVVIAVGRQGFDLMGVRLFASAMAVVATTRVQCTGLGECVNAYEVGVPVLGIYCTVLMWFVAIPVNMLWNRGVSSLAPELPWRRLVAMNRWQKAALGVTAAVAALAYYLSLGIPAY